MEVTPMQRFSPTRVRSVENGLREVLLIAVVLLLLAPAAKAGVVDSPLSAPFTQHVLTVPGYIDTGFLAAFITCTNLDATPVTVGVEVFGSSGGGAANDPVATSLSVAPGATVTFGSAAAGISINSDLAAGSISKGSARVLATTKKLARTAFIADTGNAPPTSAWQLTIIKGTRQKAAN